MSILLNVETFYALWKGRRIQLTLTEAQVLCVVGIHGSAIWPCSSMVIGEKIWPESPHWNWSRLMSVYAKRLREQFPGILNAIGKTGTSEWSGYWLSDKLVLVKNIEPQTG